MYRELDQRANLEHRRSTLDQIPDSGRGRVYHDFNNSIPFDFMLELEHGSEFIIEDIMTGIIRGRHKQDRPSTRTKMEKTIEILVANLLKAREMHDKTFVSISMRREDYVASRYNSGISFHHMREVMGHLRGMSWMEEFPGYYNKEIEGGKRTRIRMADDMYKWIKRRREEEGRGRRLRGGGGETGSFYITGTKTLKSLVRQGRGEVIILHDEKKKRCSYSDTPAITGMRKRLEALNEFADQHRLDVLVPDDEFVKILHRQSAEDVEYDGGFVGEQIDLSRKRSFRVFNRSFDLGGRFYGGWWQAVPSLKRPYITINGQPTRELDYKGMHLAMLYAEVGEPLDGDPYALDGIGPEFRDLIKVTLMKVINAEKDQRVQRPMEKERWAEMDEYGRMHWRTREFGADLPPDMDWKRLQKAVAGRHPAIAGYFRSGAGIRLQRRDSDIAESVMLSMMDRGVLALSIHDSFIVDYRRADLLREVMAQTYRDHMGVDIEIKADRSIVDEIGSTSEEAVSAYVAQMVASDEYQAYRERAEAW